MLYIIDFQLIKLKYQQMDFMDIHMCGMSETCL